MLVAGTVVLASPLVYLLGRMLMRARARGHLGSPRLLLGLTLDRKTKEQEEEEQEQEEEEVGFVPTPAVHSWVSVACS